MWILPPARIWRWGGAALLLKRLGVSSFPLFKTNHIPCQVWQWVSCWSPSPVKQPVVSPKIFFFWSSRSHFRLFCPCFSNVMFLFCPWGVRGYTLVVTWTVNLWTYYDSGLAIGLILLIWLNVFLFLLLQLLTRSRLLYFFTLTAAPPCGSWRTCCLL